MYNDLSVQCFRPVFRGSKPDRHVDDRISEVVSKLIRCDMPTQLNGLLAAIGEPQMIDTAKDPRLGRIF